MTLPMRPDSDTIDVADVARALRRQWRAIIGFTALGIAAAVAIILFAPKRYEGKATVLARTAGAGGGSVIGRMNDINELLGGGGGGLGASSVETELQMLKSRALAGEAVDSLHLQVAVREPAGVPAHHIVTAVSLPGSFAPREVSFSRRGSAYAAAGDSISATVTPGQPASLPIGTITLATTALPDRFVLLLMDREDAIGKVERRVKAVKAGGEVLRVTYRGESAAEAAAVPNVLIASYLERRRTVDRGANQRRLEYVTRQVEETAEDLARTERELRQHQENTRMFDAELVSEAELAVTGRLRQSLIDLQVDEGALKQLLQQADQGIVTSRDLAAYPAFIRGSAVSPMVTQLSELEARRTALLERRTERDPEVQAIDQSMRNVSASIVAMARSYAASVSQQRAQYQARLDAAEQRLRDLPAANERVGRLQRDVLRLTQLYTALQAQLVEARLGAIGEGGDVRQIDAATTPKHPSFPQPIMTLGIGTVGGFAAGLIAALFLGWFGRWLRDPVEIERLTGVSAQRIEAGTPLFVAGGAAPRTVLVIPLDDRAQTRLVAERLARTAASRALPVEVLDVAGHTGAGNNGNGAAPGHDIAHRIDIQEQQGGMLVVQLPSLLNEGTIAALRETRPVVLVAPPGPVDRARLTSALDLLRRLQVPCAGIVLSDPLDAPRPRALL